jgi:hypothetical protein
MLPIWNVRPITNHACEIQEGYMWYFPLTDRRTYQQKHPRRMGLPAPYEMPKKLYQPSDDRRTTELAPADERLDEDEELVAWPPPVRSSSPPHAQAPPRTKPKYQAPPRTKPKYELSSVLHGGWMLASARGRGWTDPLCQTNGHRALPWCAAPHRRFSFHQHFTVLLSSLSVKLLLTRRTSCIKYQQDQNGYLDYLSVLAFTKKPNIQGTYLISASANTSLSSSLRKLPSYLHVQWNMLNAYIHIYIGHALLAVTTYNMCVWLQQRQQKKHEQ